MMLVVFEGIDGSGKTTLSNRVARALERRGLRVRHVREGGRLASPTAEAIRQLARDQRHAALSPRAELFLYAARDAQQLDEAMRPALAEAEVVIADRFAYTALVMATAGRGLDETLARPVVDALASEVTPDLAVLVDCEPYIARARRRIGKLAEPASRPASRKGLAGEGLMHRLRDGYRTLAAAAPERWLVVDNSDADLHRLVEGLVDAILAMRASGGIAAARAALRHACPERAASSAATDPAAARAAFLDWIDRRMEREPALAGYFLAGLHGPGYDELRRALVTRAPAVLADGLGGMDDACSWELRLRLLDVAPGAVARSLHDAAGESPVAWALRDQLADAAPTEVAASLRGRFTPRAWTLRQRLAELAPAAVAASLAGDDSARAWAWRDAWLTNHGGTVALVDPLVARIACQSVAGLSSPRAWAWRELALPVAPAASLASLAGLVHERAWSWRWQWLERATRPVLRSLDGIDDERAHALRQRALPFAPEAITSLRGLDSARAFHLREQAVDRWPVAVARSLADPLAWSVRAQALFRRLLVRYPGHVGLWKHAGAAAPLRAEARTSSAAS